MGGLNPDELINSLPDSLDCMYCEGFIKILGKLWARISWGRFDNLEFVPPGPEMDLAKNSKIH